MANNKPIPGNTSALDAMGKSKRFVLKKGEIFKLDPTKKYLITITDDMTDSDFDALSKFFASAPNVMIVNYHGGLSVKEFDPAVTEVPF